MGCNTSKESSVHQEENKQNHDDKTTEKEPAGDQKKEEVESAENHVSDRSGGGGNSKPTSARTSNSHTSATLEAGGVGRDSASKKSSICRPLTPSNSGKEVKDEETSEITGEEEQAATKIQAVFRGHKARQSMKQPTTGTATSNTTNETTPASNSNANKMAEEVKENVEELSQAATKIQATYRGHLTRKHEADKKGEDGSTSKGKDDKKEQEELGIDLTDPELNKAAAKIQASFRGHMGRKEHEPQNENTSAPTK